MSKEELPFQTTAGSLREQIGNRIGHLRWEICALLFFATTLNYVDRQVIGVLKPVLDKSIGWNEIEYGNVVFTFQTAYAIGLLFMGALVDKIGVKKGLILAVFGWSLASMSHGLATTVIGFCIARFALGITESTNFPASIKAVGEWFPKKERALATGIFNAGSNVGALITPMTVPLIVKFYGWQAAFYITGSLGLLWLIFWCVLYQTPENHPRLSPAERDYIKSDSQEPMQKIPWVQLLSHPQTWGFSIAKFLTDPIWYFYLFWVPDFLHKRHGLDIVHLGVPLVVIYLMTDIGSIGGGWLSSRLIKIGWTVNAARKTAMLICALCVVPVLFASQVTDLWLAVFLIGLAASAHQGFSANLFTVASDTVPRQAVSSVVGFGGMLGAVGGMLIAQVVGHVLQYTHGNYNYIFLIPPSAYLIGLLNLHLWLPKLEEMKFEKA